MAMWMRRHLVGDDGRVVKAAAKTLQENCWPVKIQRPIVVEVALWLSRWISLMWKLFVAIEKCLLDKRVKYAGADNEAEPYNMEVVTIYRFFTSYFPPTASMLQAMLHHTFPSRIAFDKRFVLMSDWSSSLRKAFLEMAQWLANKSFRVETNYKVHKIHCPCRRFNNNSLLSPHFTRISKQTIDWQWKLLFAQSYLAFIYSRFALFMTPASSHANLQAEIQISLI